MTPIQTSLCHNALPVKPLNLIAGSEISRTKKMASNFMLFAGVMNAVLNFVF